MRARFSTPVQTGPGAHPASCTMGTGSFPGVKGGRGVTLTAHPLLVPLSWKGRAIPLLFLWAVRPVQECTLQSKPWLPEYSIQMILLNVLISLRFFSHSIMQLEVSSVLLFCLMVLECQLTMLDGLRTAENGAVSYRCCISGCSITQYTIHVLICSHLRRR